MDAKEALAAVAVIVAALNLASPWWRDRFVIKRQERRTAARRLRDFASQVRGSMTRLELGLDDETSAGELLSQWRTELDETHREASLPLTHRTQSIIELLEHADRLALRKDMGWIEVSAYALIDYERAAAAEAKGRRSGAVLLPTGDELARLVEQGQTLQRGLQPLREAIRRRVDAIDLRRRRRDYNLSTLNGVLLGASVTYLILTLS
ncbi:MAG: hypothetical protein ACR2LK_03355 [Solirubrobacteraceae bacterium]